jgi:hypothetical protein
MLALFYELALYATRDMVKEYVRLCRHETKISRLLFKSKGKHIILLHPTIACGSDKTVKNRI